MKGFFKWVFYLIVLGFVVYYANDGLNRWQEYRDAEAIKGTPQGKLPEWASPISYDLKLTIDPTQEDFSGEVLIDVELTEASDVVWLHGKDFDITESQWQDAEGKWYDGEYTEVGHSGVVKFAFGQTVQPQTLQLKMAFHRDFATDLAGLYRVERKDGADIFTQFQATDARKAFPSFDEPRFKTPFTFQLTVPKAFQAFASTPEVNREAMGEVNVIQYATSKPLPTYLVAFAVGEFDVVDGGNLAPNMYRDYPVPFRAIAVKGKGDKLKYAVEHTERILVALEEYFGRGYPYEKLDIIAVPDFAAGAMENVGLITYREQLLLLGDNPTISQQRSYYRVHAHELAHQWFGNLVTMPWWNDIWLNESFANWMEGKIVAQLRPDLRGDEGEIKSVHSVMDQDELVAARQIREPIKSNGDIDNAFDGITYTKGGGVLNMFERYLGEEVFRRGVQEHLKRFEWGNATAPDFIESMAQSTGQQDIVQAFMSFIEQPGVPLVEFEHQCITAEEVGQSYLSLDLKQSRYFPLGSKGDANQTWQIPMCIASVAESRETFCFILDQAEASQQFPVKQCPSVVVPNNQASGYYRYSFSEAQWQNMIANLTLLNNFERISLRSNLLASMKAGKIKPEQVIRSASAYVQLPDYESKFLPMNSLELLAERFASDDERQQMNVYLKSLYGDYLNELGFEANTTLDEKEPALAANLRRGLISLFALRLKDEALRKSLTEKAKAYVGFDENGSTQDQTARETMISKDFINEDAMNSDLVSIALSVSVQDLGVDFYNHLEALLDKVEDGTHRDRILTGMSATQDPELSERLLGMVVSTDTRMNEKGIMLFGQLSMEETRTFAYEWFKDKYGILSMFLPEQYLAFAPYVGSGFCEQEKLDDLQTFFADEIKPGSAAERNMAKVTEMITNCEALKSSIGSMDIPTENIVLETEESAVR